MARRPFHRQRPDIWPGPSPVGTGSGIFVGRAFQPDDRPVSPESRTDIQDSEFAPGLGSWFLIRGGAPGPPGPASTPTPSVAGPNVNRDGGQEEGGPVRS